MKTIDRLLLKSYAGPMVLTFFIVVFIFVMQFLWMYMDEIAGKDLGWDVIGELLFWTALSTIPTALPLSTLLASIMTMGNLGENNELLALKSAGISLGRIMRPLMVLVFIISLLAFYISNNLLPLSNLKMTTLLRDVRKKNPAFALDVGVFTTNLPGYAIKIGDKDPKTNLLYDVMIYDHKMVVGNSKVTIADSGYISVTKSGNYLITLYDGNLYEDTKNMDGTVRATNPFSHQEFVRQEFLVEGQEWDRTDEEQNKGAMQMLNLVDLTRSIDSLKTLQEIESARAASYYIGSNAFTNVGELDTAQVQMNRYVKVVNLDSIYASYDDKQKYDAISRALSKADESVKQMEFVKAEREIKRKEIAQGEVEWHLKFTLSVACIIFFFVGAPLGAIIRKGGLGMPMVVSLFLFIIYWVIFSTGKKMAIQGTWNAAFAMWLPTAILLPLGIFLTYKATTDSSLFNADKYLVWVRKIFGRRKIGKIDLSQIIPATKSVSIEEVEVKIAELNDLSREFDKKYRLHKSLFSASSKDEWTMVDGQNMLDDIYYKYQNLLSVLVVVDSNQVQELVKQYPQLNIKSFQLVNSYANASAIGGVSTHFMLYRKRERLRYVLFEIVKINDLVSVSLARNE